MGFAVEGDFTNNYLTLLGAVILSGFINAAKLSSQAAGIPLEDHRILFFGAGSAGIGVAKQLLSFFTVLGLSEEEARNRIYVCVFTLPIYQVVDSLCQTVDSKGLITADRKGLQAHKTCLFSMTRRIRSNTERCE